MAQKKIIVIGGNAAGPAAAAKAKRVDPSAEVIMIEASPFISTGTCELPYLISGLIDDYKKIIFYDDKNFYDEKGVRVYTKHFVEAIDRRNKKIAVRNLADGSLYNFDYTSLILATGSNSKPIFSLAPDLQNCFYFKNVNDYLKLSNFLQSSAKKLAVIGSGYIGLELIDALSQCGHEIIVFEKENYPMPSAEIPIQKLIFEMLNKNSRIEFIGGEKNVEWIINGNKIIAAKIGSRLIDVDGAVVSIGFEPNSSLALSAGLQLGNFSGIRVNKKLQTTDASIYAAGDCIESKNFITNQFEFFPIATLAQKSGHVAGENSVGGNAVFNSVIKNISVKIFENYFAQVGLTEDEAAKNNFSATYVESVSNNLVEVMPDSKSIYGKIVFEKGSRRILGASFLGGREVDGFSNLISSMILQRSPIDLLAKINYNYTPPLSPFVNLLSILGRKAIQQK